MLLLQRSLSDSYGGYWEAPAGGVDATIDGTILEATAREVREESGLNVSRFVDLVAVDEWTSGRGRSRICCIGWPSLRFWWRCMRQDLGDGKRG